MALTISRLASGIAVFCIIMLASCEQAKEIKTVSTIDSVRQAQVKEILMSSMKRDHCDWGCAVLMKTETGEIVANVNLSGDKAGKNFSELYDFAILKQIVPGHMFTLASLMAGFEDGLFTPDDMVETGKGSCKFSDIEMKDNCEDGFGNIPIGKAFTYGSNIGVSKAIFNSYNDDQQGFIDQLRKFKLDMLLGVDSVEPVPYFNLPESFTWSAVALPLLAIGYECKMTPLQIMGFYNSIATGKRIRPVTEKNDTIKIPVVLDEALYSTATLKYARQLLDNTTESHLKNAMGSIKISGHSSVVINPGDKKSFTQIACAYFPTDKPEYTCIVVMNNYNPEYSFNAVIALRDIIGSIYCNFDKNIPKEQQPYEDSVVEVTK